MDWLIGIASVTAVCALVGILLFVLMHMMAGSWQTIARDETITEEQNRKEG